MRGFVFILFFTVSSQVDAQQMPVPVFEESEYKTESGYVQLSWEWEGSLDEEYRFQLEQSHDDSFTQSIQIYEGPDFARFLSGLESGDYYYRIRVITDDNAFSSWSQPVWIEVKHHSLSLALSLFGVGAVVFMLTVGIVIHGNRKAS